MQQNTSPTPLGQALALLGNFMRNGSIVQSTSSQYVKSWAVLAPNGDLTVLLLNKDYIPTQQTVSISGSCTAHAVTSVWRLSGTGPADTAPVLAPQPSVLARYTGDSLSIGLPGVSITAVVLGAYSECNDTAPYLDKLPVQYTCPQWVSGLCLNVGSSTTPRSHLNLLSSGAMP